MLYLLISFLKTHNIARLLVFSQQVPWQDYNTNFGIFCVWFHRVTAFLGCGGSNFLNLLKITKCSTAPYKAISNFVRFLRSCFQTINWSENTPVALKVYLKPIEITKFCAAPNKAMSGFESPLRYYFWIYNSLSNPRCSKTFSNNFAGVSCIWSWFFLLFQLLFFCWFWKTLQVRLLLGYISTPIVYFSNSNTAGPNPGRKKEEWKSTKTIPENSQQAVFNVIIDFSDSIWSIPLLRAPY